MIQTALTRRPALAAGPKDPNAHFVTAPGKRLLHRVGLAFVWKRATGQKRRAPAAALNLVSFIDFLVVTTIFLLMQFSAEGRSTTNDIHVPSALNAEAMVDAPIVSVDGGQIFVDGVTAGSTREVEDLGRIQKIDGLFQILKSKRQLWLQLEPNKQFPGVCVLVLDEQTKALTVKSLFQTAAYAGYPNVSFMVKKLSSH